MPHVASAVRYDVSAETDFASALAASPEVSPTSAISPAVQDAVQRPLEMPEEPVHHETLEEYMSRRSRKGKKRISAPMSPGATNDLQQPIYLRPKRGGIYLQPEVVHRLLTPGAAVTKRDFAALKLDDWSSPPPPPQEGHVGENQADAFRM